MKAALSPDGGTVTLTGGFWTGSFDVACLPQQIALYTALRDRKDGRFAHHYAGTVRALEEIKTNG